MSRDGVWSIVDRRWFLPSLGVLLLLAFPLLSVVAPAPPPEALPEKPGTLTAENVVGYVGDYEHAEVYRARDPPEDRDFHLDCPAALDRQMERAFYVVARCTGGFTEPDGSSGSFGGSWSFYLIDETSTIRIPTEGGAVTDASPGATGAFYVANFDDGDHAVGVEVRSADAGDGEATLDRRYDVGAGEGLSRSHVATPGEYVLIASLEDGTTARYAWNLSADLAARRTPAIYVTPGGDLVVRPVPEPEPPKPMW